jgi:hypothetical protein
VFEDHAGLDKARLMNDMYDALSIAAFDHISRCLRGWPLMLTAVVPLVPCKEFAASEGCGSWRFLSCQQLLRDVSSSLESFLLDVQPGGSEISFVLRVRYSTPMLTFLP